MASIDFKAFDSHVRESARACAGWGRDGGRSGVCVWGAGATAQNGRWKGFDLTFTARQLRRQALKVSPLGAGGGPFPDFLASALLLTRLASPVLYSGPGLELAVRGCLSAWF